MDGRLKSLNGNKYAQVFATKQLFVVVYLIQCKFLAREALMQFIHEFGRPEHVTFDDSQMQNGKKTEFMRNIRKYAKKYKTTEPNRPNHNSDEGVIREIRKKWCRIITRRCVPKPLLGLQPTMGMQDSEQDFEYIAGTKRLLSA
jgi:hypothetical protein